MSSLKSLENCHRPGLWAPVTFEQLCLCNIFIMKYYSRLGCSKILLGPWYYTKLARLMPTHRTKQRSPVTTPLIQG